MVECIGGYEDGIFIHDNKLIYVLTTFETAYSIPAGFNIASSTLTTIDGFAFSADYSKLFICRHNGTGFDGNIYYYSISVTPTSFTATFQGVYVNCGIALGTIWQSEPGGFIINGVDAGVGSGARAAYIDDSGSVFTAGAATTLHSGGQATISWSKQNDLYYAAGGAGFNTTYGVSEPCTGGAVSEYAATMRGDATTGPTVFTPTYDESISGCPTANGSPYTLFLGNKSTIFSDGNAYVVHGATVKDAGGLIGGPCTFTLEAVDPNTGIPSGGGMTAIQSNRGGATGIPNNDPASTTGDREIWLHGPILNAPMFVQSYLHSDRMYIVSGSADNSDTSLWQNSVPPASGSIKLWDGVPCEQFSRAQCYKIPCRVPPENRMDGGIELLTNPDVIQWIDTGL